MCLLFTTARISKKQAHLSITNWNKIIQSYSYTYEIYYILHPLTRATESQIEFEQKHLSRPFSLWKKKIRWNLFTKIFQNFVNWKTNYQANYCNNRWRHQGIFMVTMVTKSLHSRDNLIKVSLSFPWQLDIFMVTMATDNILTQGIPIGQSWCR